MTDVQLGFEGMPRRLLQAAPARLGCYLDCPRRYRFSYLDRPPPQKGPPWAHNSFGAAVHTALANWWKAPRERRTVEQVGRFLDDAWLVDGYRDTAQRESARERAREMLTRYVANLDPDDEPVGVERTVALKTDHAALFGRVDRIDDRPGEGLVIVDYKTGRQVLTLDDARSSLALAIYALGAARTLRRQCRRVELHHLPTGDVLAWDHSDEGLARHLRRADSIAREIAALDERFRAGVSDEEADRLYPVSVGPMCAWCDFHRVCPEGHEAVAARDSWAGVEQPVG
jgi:putative RecB family exonuclease